MPDDKPFAETLFVAPNISHNLGVLAFNRVFASLVAGLALGVIGFAGWSGFLVYFLTHALVGVLLGRKVGPDSEPYFQSQWAVHTHEVLSSTSFLTFVLFWTLAYSCIHLF